MDASEKLARDAESKKAEKFYEQALLLVDCCMIPEAIRLLEQAIQIKPDYEIYRESLAILQMNYLQTEQQSLGYANVTRPKPNLGTEKENVSSSQWNTKKTRTKQSPDKTPWSPAVSSSCYGNTCEQSTIDNPWASFLKSNSKRKKPKSSPIDGLSEIEIPPTDDNFYTQSPSYKQGYKHHGYQEQSDTPITCNGSQKAVHKDRRSVQYTQDNHVNASTEYVGRKKDDLPENHFTNSRENLDTRFLEELCMARESATDDWAKYYDVLCGGLGDREEETCKESDVLHHNRPRYSQYSDTLDEITETDNVNRRSDLEKDNLRSQATASMCGSDVCSKCGHSKESEIPLLSPIKNRIHFVNGACVSSPSVLNCTCNKQSKSCSGERTARMPLSSSQQEFYHNLRFYFGSEKVKSKKVAEDAENKVKSSDLHKNFTSASFNTCDTNVSSTSSKDDDPLNVKSKQNDTETAQHSTKCKLKNERKRSREHIGCKVTSDNKCSESRKVKTSLSADQVKKDQKSSGDQGFQPAGYKQKARAHSKVQSKTKEPNKTEQVKNSKEGISQGNDSQRKQPRVEDGVKSRGYPKGRAEDISRPVRASEIREKPNQKHKDKQPALAEIDLASFFRGIYQTGATVASKCFQVSMSIVYYILLLIILLFGFFVYCVWFAACWVMKKILHLTAAERLFTAVKKKISSLFEWLKKCRETRRKNSAEGQTYNLPKNGDAAIRHMQQNKDKDPYSVLGVPSDASDDDIKKQYRKLAVLIHPDKNPHSEADEAFKILANAFDILSDADKRREYDRESAWKKRAEEREERFGHPASAEQFFADLGKKMQEMQNYLHCNQCDGKHRRYSTDRFILTARFCSRCNTRHAAKEGDLWAESSFLGYKLHFYACMEGKIYDVTEWAACQGINRLEANPHTVHLKLKTRQSYPSGFNTRSEEEDFENFMRAFFGQFNPSREEKYHGSNKQPKKRKRKKR